MLAEKPRIDAIGELASLAEGAGVRVLRSVPATRLTTFSLGAGAEILFEPETPAELSRLLSLVGQYSEPYRVIGAGSNILFPDFCLTCPLIRLGRGFSRYQIDVHESVSVAEIEHLSHLREFPSLVDSSGEDVFVLALGGAPLMTLSRETSKLGLAGLEFAAGIPATMGGAVWMNAGAHGAEISEVIHKIFLLRADGRTQILSREELKVSYRSMNLSQGSIVLAVLLRLSRDRPERVLKRRSECLEYRKKTQPLSMPSAGSAFRNPSLAERQKLESRIANGVSKAAEFLEGAKLKGYRKGGVGFSEMHSNWLVKLEQEASATDARFLLSLGKERVLETFGLELQPEIIVW